MWKEFPHDDVIKWKHFPRYWPFVRGIHLSRVNSPHKGQWRGALMFSLMCVWINGWENNREAGDLRRHRAHYDVIVMISSSMSSHWKSFKDQVTRGLNLWVSDLQLSYELLDLKWIHLDSMLYAPDFTNASYCMLLFQMSILSLTPSVNALDVCAPTGIYQGVKVAMRAVRKDHVTFTKDDLRELNMVRWNYKGVLSQ